MDNILIWGSMSQILNLGPSFYEMKRRRMSTKKTKRFLFFDIKKRPISKLFDVSHNIFCAFYFEGYEGNPGTTPAQILSILTDSYCCGCYRILFLVNAQAISVYFYFSQLRPWGFEVANVGKALALLVEIAPTWVLSAAARKTDIGRPPAQKVPKQSYGT